MSNQPTTIAEITALVCRRLDEMEDAKREHTAVMHEARAAMHEVRDRLAAIEGWVGDAVEASGLTDRVEQLESDVERLEAGLRDDRGAGDWWRDGPPQDDGD